MVTTTPTTTAIAISISGDKCSAKKHKEINIFIQYVIKGRVYLL